MSKYVLYEGKAYEVLTQDQAVFSGEIRLVGKHESRPVHTNHCTEITEAEYHARKLINDPKNTMPAETQVLIEHQIEKWEQERQPKPEVTSRHIDCLVEWRFKRESAFVLAQLDEDFERYNQEFRLPRQPVPLAFHKHDGGYKPEWVSDLDGVLYLPKHKPEEIQAKCGKNIDWLRVMSFAVIKPILPEGI